MTRKKRASAFALALAVMAITATPVNAQVRAQSPGNVFKGAVSRYFFQWITGQSPESTYNPCA
jgi:hypothetical protein